jgi:hypothetical protein
MNYLYPNDDPPSKEDYAELYAQFIALILSTGKTEMTVPHKITHPKFEHKKMLIQKKVDFDHTTYSIVPEP